MFPFITPGQMVDEVIGLASGANGSVFTDLTATFYTVPAGYSLLIHGFMAFGANVASTIVIGGTTIYSATPGAAAGTICTDRNRMYYGCAGSGFTGTQILLNGTPAAVPGSFTMFGATTPFAVVVCEHSSYLFWPIAAGLTVQVTGAGTHFSFWGTLIPT